MVDDPKPKSSYSRRTGAYLAAFILAVAVGAVAVAVWREIRRSIAVEDRAREVRRDAEKLAADREALARMLAALRDPAVLEREAKVQLNLRRPDEQVVVVVPDGGDAVPVQPGATEASTSTAPSSASAEPSGAAANARSWWEYFFGARLPR